MRYSEGEAEMTSEKRAFILGMVTAFSECVAGGCKRLALSPPLMPEEYARIAPEACLLVERHGLIHHHETNPELPEGERWEWRVSELRPPTLSWSPPPAGPGLPCPPPHLSLLQRGRVRSLLPPDLRALSPQSQVCLQGLFLLPH